MIQQPPVALIIFSNDLDSYLSNIEIERKYIEEALEQYHDSNRLKVITRSSVTIQDIFDLFNRYKGRIALFHFAGHASGVGLQLNDAVFNQEIGRTEGLADLFQREVADGQLQLVFLNGCSTQGQVEKLQQAGVPTIIATNAAINDTKALHFARTFYNSLAHSHQPTAFQHSVNLQQAFETAIAYLKSTESDVEIEKTAKGLKLKRKKGTPIPWEFYSEQPNWTLPTTVFEEIEQKNYRLRRFLLVFVPILAIGFAYLLYQYQVGQTPIDLTVQLDNTTPNAELPALDATLKITYKGKPETQININDKTTFENLVPSRSDKIHLFFSAIGFEKIDTSFVLSETMILPIERNNHFAWVKGNITDGKNNPIGDATITVQGKTTLSKANGNYELQLPFDLQRPKQQVVVFKKGYERHSKKEPIFPDESVDVVLFKKN